MSLQSLLLNILAFPVKDDSVHVGMESDLGDIVYDDPLVDAYVTSLQYQESILSATHIRRYDIPVTARIFLRYYGRSVTAVLAKSELKPFAPILWPLGAVWIDRNGSFEHKRLKLHSATERGFPLLANFHNKYTNPEKQGIGIATAEWSVTYDLPVIPVGFNYSAGRTILSAPEQSFIVFGQPVPPLSRSGMDFDGSSLLITENNKDIMKSYVGGIIRKTYDFFDMKYPEYLHTRFTS